MTVVFRREIDLTTAILQRMRLPVHILRPQDALTVLDSGFREILGLDVDYAAAYRFALHWSKERTIYKVIDQFMCNYVYLLLPDKEDPTAMIIGPYLTVDPTREMLLEQTERLGLDMSRLQQQAEYYASLPVFNDPSALMAVVTCLGEVLWGGPEAFHTVDVNYEQFISIPSEKPAGEPIEQADILRQMKQLEERYAYENELMEIVSKGLTQRAEVMMSSVSQLNYQHRLADPLRNMKNYCIICNTLLRKAAEQGGVHPLHLDKTSTQFAHRIENAPTLDRANALIGEMIRSYCRLVHRQGKRHYAAAVQKTLTYIDANLSGDLSLNSLAALMQLSPGYLSALFHRETGRTLAEYINAQRMKAALQLLKSTHLQIQTVAQLSGFADPNYFGKLFKRCYGVTPQQYRREQLGPSPPGGP
ncbi:MAG: helix-turn-helix domain-containing protein [Clostridia bacterium]|nr:helix-turn-helix domain-containing protein [Clostridia bacterium]